MAVCGDLTTLNRARRRYCVGLGDIDNGVESLACNLQNKRVVGSSYPWILNYLLLSKPTSLPPAELLENDSKVMLYLMTSGFSALQLLTPLPSSLRGGLEFDSNKNGI